jgi:DNA-binding NarL/FixJ family response regulator
VYVPAFALHPDATAAPRTGSRKPPTGVPTPQSLCLTARQVEVMALLVQGRSNKAIGRALNLAEPTVKNHVTALLRALQVSSRTEAVVAVTAWEWVMPTGPVRP